MHWRTIAEAERRDHVDGDEASRQLVFSLRAQIDALQAELEELEPVIGAAVLAATAFRLRDQEGLIMALRGLVRGLHRLDRPSAAAADLLAAATPDAPDRCEG